MRETMFHTRIGSAALCGRLSVLAAMVATFALVSSPPVADARGAGSESVHKSEPTTGEPPSATVESESEGSWYRNPPCGYEVWYPHGWGAVEAQPRQDSLAIWADSVLMNGELQKVTFLEEDYEVCQGWFQVCVAENPAHLPLEDWIAEHEPTDVTGGTMIQSTADTTLGGCPAKLLSVFAFDHEQIEVICPRGEGICRVSFAGSNPNDPRVDEHQALYNRMLASFRFTQ